MDEQSPDRSNAPAFRVTVCDGSRLAKELRGLIEQEVKAIFSEFRVGLHWDGRRCGPHSLQRIRPNEAIAYLMKRLPGSRRHTRNGRKIMACVVRDSKGLPGPIIYVSKRATKQVLEATLSHEPSGFVMGRAMGRVLAHELAHRFLYTARHADEGILKPNLLGTELIETESKHLYFTNEQQRSLEVVARAVDASPNNETPAADEAAVVTGPIY